MAIFTLRVRRRRWRKEWGFPPHDLAVGLTTYLVGQTGSRLPVVLAALQLNRGIDITWMDAAWMIVVLAATTAIISIGLMCICRAFARRTGVRVALAVAGAAGDLDRPDLSDMKKPAEGGSPLSPASPPLPLSQKIPSKP